MLFKLFIFSLASLTILGQNADIRRANVTGAGLTNSFNANQITLDSSGKVVVKSGALLTNVVSDSSVTINGTSTFLQMNSSGGGVNYKYFDFYNAGSEFGFRRKTDNGVTVLDTPWKYNSDGLTFNITGNTISLGTANTERWIINGSGAFNPSVNNTYDIGNSLVNPRDVYIARYLYLTNISNGNILNVGTNGQVYGSTSISASSFTITGASFVIASDATVGNTGTETTLLGTAGVGSKTLSANTFTLGKSSHGIFRGRYSSAAVAGTLRVKVKLGSTVICDTGVQTMPNASSGKIFDVDFDLVCRTTGAGGTIFGQGKVLIGDVTGLVPQVLPMVNTTTSTIDTTVTQVLDVTALWGTADLGNTATISLGSYQ